MEYPTIEEIEFQHGIDEFFDLLFEQAEDGKISLKEIEPFFLETREKQQEISLKLLNKQETHLTNQVRC